MGSQRTPPPLQDRLIEILTHPALPQDAALWLLGRRKEPARELTGSVVELMRVCRHLAEGTLAPGARKLLKDLVRSVLQVCQSELACHARGADVPSAREYREIARLCWLTLPRL